QSRRGGSGGGTTRPGKLLAAVDRDAVDALAARLPRGCALVSATNGKTTTCGLAAGGLAPAGRPRARRGGSGTRGAARAQRGRREPDVGGRVDARERARRGAGPVRGRRGCAA